MEKENINLQKGIYFISGMHNASCAINIEGLLKAQPGVLSVSVNYAAATASLLYDKSLVDGVVLRKVVNDLGYVLTEEKDTQQLEKTEDKEKKRRLFTLRIHFFGALIITVFIFWFHSYFRNWHYTGYLEFGVVTLFLLVFGRMFFIDAWREIKQSDVNLNTSLIISVSIAWLYSVCNLFFSEVLLYRESYFEMISLLVLVVLFGRLLEERLRYGSVSLLRDLSGLLPVSVHKLLDDGTEVEINISFISKGDRLKIKSGDIIPVDGEVLIGSSFVNESMISGKPVPVEKLKGDKVFAGTRNKQGTLVILVKQHGTDTVFAGIVTKVRKIYSEKILDRSLDNTIAGRFVPIILLLSIITFLLWLFTAEYNVIALSVTFMLSVLIVSCPAMLSWVTPCAIMRGIRKGSNMGILIKDSRSLELFHKIDAVILSKIGTMTEGKPVIENVAWVAGEERKKELIGMICFLESKSEHLFTEAILTYCQDKDKENILNGNIENISVNGTKAKIGDYIYLIGNERYMLENGVDISKSVSRANDDFILYFVKDKSLVALFYIADKIKENVVSAVRQLQKQEIEVYLLSGDDEKQTFEMARQVGIRTYLANAMPDDKVAFVRKFQAQGKIVAMVGNDINDAQALAQADVGITMGNGSDLAMKVASVIIRPSDLNKIIQSVVLSQKIIRKIQQNIFGVIFFTGLTVLLAGGILYPLFGIVINQMIASCFILLEILLILLNSFFLMLEKQK